MSPHAARRLHTWDQAAPRTYMRQVFCFAHQPGPDTAAAAAAAVPELLRRHLEAALARAAADVPEFAGRVALEPAAAGSAGRLVVLAAPGDVIPVDVRDDRCCPDGSCAGVTHAEVTHPGSSHPDSTHAAAPPTFAELRAAGFPARAFVGPAVDLPGPLVENGPAAPVTVVQARLLCGGLLVGVKIHHALTDGHGMLRFVARLAAYTRCLAPGAQPPPPPPPTSTDADLPSNLGPAALRGLAFEELILRCPEYHVLPAPTGPLAFRSSPTNPPYDAVPKAGRIFVFGPDNIALLKRAAQQWRPSPGSGAGASSRCYPSTFACLAALTWAHATAVRLRVAAAGGPGFVNEAPPEDGARDCRIVLPASWARRAFADWTPSYTGNAVGMVDVTAGVDDLLAAARSSRDALPAAGQAFALLVHSIEASLAGLDQDFVTVRTAMIRAAPDPRLGVNVDPQNPRDFIFNSWRHLGADIRWGLPGTGDDATVSGEGVVADAVRRAQHVWNMGAGLIMPGRKECAKYEVLVTLDEMSLHGLCLDPCWTSWVDQVLE